MESIEHDFVIQCKDILTTEATVFKSVKKESLNIKETETLMQASKEYQL